MPDRRRVREPVRRGDRLAHDESRLPDRRRDRQPDRRRVRLLRPTKRPPAPTDEETASPTDEETASPTDEETASPSDEEPTGETEAETGTPSVTLPPTDGLSGGSSSGSGGLPVAILAMGGLLAAVLLLTPATLGVKRARNRD